MKPKNDLFYAMSHGVNRGSLKKGKFDQNIKLLYELEAYKEDDNYKYNTNAISIQYNYNSNTIYIPHNYIIKTM